MSPEPLDPLHRYPTLEDLVARHHEVSTRLAQLEACLAGDQTQAERAGTLAHIASLTRRKQWYLARIRARKPVQTLGVDVEDTVNIKEAGL